MRLFAAEYSRSINSRFRSSRLQRFRSKSYRTHYGGIHCYEPIVSSLRIVNHPFSAKTIHAPKPETTKVMPWSNQLRAKFRANMVKRSGGSCAAS
jgi:hypothetical protein